MDLATEGVPTAVAADLCNEQKRLDEVAAEQRRLEASYDELMNQLRLFTRDLAVSLEVHDFDKCVLLDASIEDLNNIRKKTRIPQRNCRSRNDVELNILELQFAVESIGMNDSDITLHYQTMTSVYEELRSQYLTIC